ncbi:MAG: histidinol-phosphate transaminase [Chromatiales bacterium]|nr:histidinol-phosphate transaminase [Chromatiales bacterium]
MTFNPKQHCLASLLNIKPYQPGKSIDDLEINLIAAEPIKLSSNENVFGPSRYAVEVIQEYADQVYLYPGNSASLLKEKIAERYGVSTTQVSLGNGSNELLEFVARCFLDKDKNAVYSQHAFEVYALATQLSGATARPAPAVPSDGEMPYGHDLHSFVDVIDERTAVVFIANPNNPTGTWLKEDELRKFMQLLDERIVVVVDQAYAEYAQACDYPDVSKWLDEYPNLIVIQTFSKIYALAGLRIGYALSSTAIADLFNRLRQPFNNNVLALKAAIASLDDKAHVENSVRLNSEGLAYLRDGCNALGLTCLPSAANFLCIEIGERAAAIYRALLRHGVIIRAIENYDMPNHLRVTVGTMEQNEHFLNTLKQLLEYS